MILISLLKVTFGKKAHAEETVKRSLTMTATLSLVVVPRDTQVLQVLMNGNTIPVMRVVDAPNIALQPAMIHMARPAI